MYTYVTTATITHLLILKNTDYFCYLTFFSKHVFKECVDVTFLTQLLKFLCSEGKESSSSTKLMLPFVPKSSIILSRKTAVTFSDFNLTLSLRVLSTVKDVNMIKANNAMFIFTLQYEIKFRPTATLYIWLWIWWLNKVVTVKYWNTKLLNGLCPLRLVYGNDRNDDNMSQSRKLVDI